MLLIRTVSLLAFATFWFLFFDLLDAEVTPRSLGVSGAPAALFAYLFYRYLKGGNRTTAAQ